MIKRYMLKEYLTYVIPTMLTFTLTCIYSIIDGIFVGNFVGDAGLAGVNVAFPLVTLIMAIGTGPSPLLHETSPDLGVDRRGCILVQDPSGATSKRAVWAGGDAVTGAATVILAMGAGKSAAAAIHEYLEGKDRP